MRPNTNADPYRALFDPDWEAADADGADDYYVFAESVDRLLRLDGLDAPDGNPLDLLFWRFIEVEFPCRRFRFSGLRIADFDALAATVPSLAAISPSAEQRGERREALRRGLQHLELPIIDLYWHDDGVLAQSLDAALAPGGWYRMRLASELEAGDRTGHPVVVLGAPEIAAPPRMYFVLRLDAVPLRAGLQLRDIFSLAHVADADLGNDDFEGGTGLPRPQPLSPDGDVRLKPIAEPAAEPPIVETPSQEEIDALLKAIGSAAPRSDPSEGLLES